MYFGEYADNQIVRFDKNHPNLTTACKQLVAGKNPCMAEVLVPVATPEAALHSIDLEGDRLWFTVANEAAGGDPQASTFGYVDLSDWAAGTPAGVVYGGLSSLGSPRSGDRHSFRGIDVAANGEIALADMHYDEIVHLTPIAP